MYLDHVVHVYHMFELEFYFHKENIVLLSCNHGILTCGMLYCCIPYNGNHPRKKSFTNFANLEAFANVFLHFLSQLEFLYMRLPESRKFSRELRKRRQFVKLFFCG